jgi:hypothetical protein
MGAENTFLMAGGVVLLMCVADLGPLIWLGLFAAMYAHHTGQFNVFSALKTGFGPTGGGTGSGRRVVSADGVIGQRSAADPGAATAGAAPGRTSGRMDAAEVSAPTPEKKSVDKRPQAGRGAGWKMPAQTERRAPPPRQYGAAGGRRLGAKDAPEPVPASPMEAGAGSAPAPAPVPTPAAKRALGAVESSLSPEERQLSLEALSVAISELSMESAVGRDTRLHLTQIKYLENIVKSRPKYHLKYRSISTSNSSFGPLWESEGRRRVMQAVGFDERDGTATLDPMTTHHEVLIRKALGKLKDMHDYNFWVE